LEHGEPLSIHLNYNDLCGDDILALTNSQVNRMTKAYENGRGITIKMSRCQVEHNKTIEGRFLSLLAGLAAKALPFLAKTVLPTLATGALGRSKTIGKNFFLLNLLSLLEKVCSLIKKVVLQNLKHFLAVLKVGTTF